MRLHVKEWTSRLAGTGPPATEGMRMLVEFWKSAGVIPEAFHVESVVDSGPITALGGR